VAVLGQRSDGDVGDVVCVDERLAHPVDRQRDLAAEHGGQEEALVEVLVEPARPDDRPVRRTPAGLLARAAPPPRPTGEQDQARTPLRDRLGGEVADRVGARSTTSGGR
jgi:hypothetical protein